MSDFKKGDRVSFLPSPRSHAAVTAEVIGEERKGPSIFLVTKDSEGKERRIRPTQCNKVA